MVRREVVARNKVGSGASCQVVLGPEGVQRRRGSGINAVMRSLVFGCLWMLPACSPAQFQQERLKDGSIKFTCELAMDECIRLVQDQCKNQRYRILEGTSETRLRDVPPFETAYRTSRLHLTCTNDGAEALLSLDQKPEAATTPTPAAGCTAGETRTCVGAAACKGGQACLPDGKGFGPCDCGPSVPPPAAAPPPETAPSSTSAGAVSQPAASSGPAQIPAAK